MRRRRLIGVYRGLLMSIWMPWLRFEVMSAAAGRGGSAKTGTGGAATPANEPDGLGSTTPPHGFVARAPTGANHFAVGCLDDCVPLCKAARGSNAGCCNRSRLTRHASRPNGWEPMRERPAAPETARQA